MIGRTTSIDDRLRRALGERLLVQEPLRHHTTFRIGGPADFFFSARTPDEMVTALRTATELALPVFLLGGGSNLLVSDDGFRGLVVHNAIEGLEFDGTAVHVGCGMDFLEMILACRDGSIGGLEFAAGIPGSVGGALYGNAGCYGQDIGSFVIECTIATPDGARVETKPATWFEFAYRDSRLKRDPRVLMTCLLQLKSGAPAASTKEIEEKREAPAVARRADRRLLLQEPAARLADPGRETLTRHPPRAGRPAARRRAVPRPARGRCDGVREAREHHRERGARDRA
jgi:UDP-N-acetylmuramate dehydrogenase